ncbi:MAG: ubiquitin-conjugating enzyme E2 [Thermoplasmata archaeon]
MGLPKDILRSRVVNEVLLCQRNLTHAISVSDPSLHSFPLEVNITLVKIPGPIWKDGGIKHRYTHKLTILITEEYPFEKPIVKWRSDIFHPNIMLPDDGGYVCTKLLDDWNFDSTLLTFVKGLEALLTNPNPTNPFGSDSCTRAAQYFNINGYNPPNVMESSKKKPRILG